MFICGNPDCFIDVNPKVTYAPAFRGPQGKIETRKHSGLEIKYGQTGRFETTAQD